MDNKSEPNYESKNILIKNEIYKKISFPPDFVVVIELLVSLFGLDLLSTD